MTADPAQVERVFLEALEKHSPEEQAAFLHDACEGEAAVRRRVERLLRRHLEVGDFLETPLVELLLPEVSSLPASISKTQEEGRDHTLGGERLPDVELPLDFLEPARSPDHLGCLGPFEVTGVVGQGGMGVVLRARDPGLHRFAAVKVLAPVLASNPTARQRFLREARAAAAVKHQHVVGIHSIGEANDLPYLVMELVDGISLRQRIEHSGPLPVSDILRIGHQVAAGLAAAHERGLIHRDIKPANILLEKGTKRALITDFGLAKAIDDVGLTGTAVVAGTPQYMSPEQARGATVDHRSDLFSLGCVLYVMCTGRPPFTGDSTVAVIQQICQQTPQPIPQLRPEIPNAIVDVVDRLLDKAPDHRIQSASAIVDLLADCQERIGVDDSDAVRAESPDDDVDVESTGDARPDTLRGDVAEPPTITLPETDQQTTAGPTQPSVTISGRLVRGVLICVAAFTLVALGAIVYRSEWLHPGDEAITDTHASGSPSGGLGDRRASDIAPDPADATDNDRSKVPPTPHDKLAAGEGVSGLFGELRRFDAPDRLGAMAVLPDGSLIYAACSNRYIYAWNLETGTEVHRLTGFAKPISDLAVAPDGTRLASCSGDRTLRIWNTETGKQESRQLLRVPARRIVFSPDGEFLLAAQLSGQHADQMSRLNPGLDLDHRELHVFDAATGKYLRSLRADTHYTYWSLAWSGDGKLIAAGTKDGYICLFDATTGDKLCTLDCYGTIVPRLDRNRQSIPFDRDGQPVHTLDFSLDSSALFSGDNMGAIWRWDVAAGDGVLVHRLRSGIVDIAVSADATWLLGVSGMEVCLVDTMETADRAVVRLPGHTSPVQEVALLPGETRAVSCSWDGTVRVWKLPPLPRG